MEAGVSSMFGRRDRWERGQGSDVWRRASVNLSIGDLRAFRGDAEPLDGRGGEKERKSSSLEVSSSISFPPHLPARSSSIIASGS